MKTKEKIKIRKKTLTKAILNQIIEIDKGFYKDFDYSNTKWYFERYSKKNKAFLLYVNKQIVGYFLFVTISERLFNDILSLKYDGDYDFPHEETNVPTDFYYMPSLVVKENYRKHSLPLIVKLKQEISKKENLVVISISPAGKALARLVLTEVGSCNDAGIFCKKSN